jgi:hypothetical protein
MATETKRALIRGEVSGADLDPTETQTLLRLERE